MNAADRITFPRDDFVLLYFAIILKGPVALGCLAAAAQLFRDDQSLIVVGMLAAAGVLFALFPPSWNDIFRGTLTSMTSSRLVLSRPFLSARELDLARVRCVAATPPWRAQGRYGGYWMWRVALDHPDGFDIPPKQRWWSRPLPHVMREEWTREGRRIVSASMFGPRGREGMEQLGRYVQGTGGTLDGSYYSTYRDLECLIAHRLVPFPQKRTAKR